jgi:hypothetical protein
MKASRQAGRWVSAFWLPLAGSWLIGLTPSAQADSLRGTVHDGSGNPIASATVAIRTAGPKVGTASMCPSCYADCAKRTITDAAGGYTIDVLDPTLKFSVIAVADGFSAKYTEKRVDPTAGPVDFVLTPRPDVPSNQLFRFKVVDSDGVPVEHAMFDPVGAAVASMGISYGGTERWVEPLAVSDEMGAVTIATLEPGLVVLGELSAKGYASVRMIVGSRARLAEGSLSPMFNDLPTSNLRVELAEADEPVPVVTMLRGAAIVGAVKNADGTPASGVPVQVVDSVQLAGAFMGWFDIATNADGVYQLDNVPVGRRWLVYAMMGSEGVSSKSTTDVSTDGTTIRMPDMQLQPGHRVSGRVVLNDGQPIPAGTRISIFRDSTWDSQAVELPPDGVFWFSSVPVGELVSLSVHVKGYRLKTDDPAAAYMRSPMTGIVDGDVAGIVVELEPGEPHPFPTGAEQDAAFDRAMEWEKQPLSRLAVDVSERR